MSMLRHCKEEEKRCIKTIVCGTYLAKIPGQSDGIKRADLLIAGVLHMILIQLSDILFVTMTTLQVDTLQGDHNKVGQVLL